MMYFSSRFAMMNTVLHAETLFVEIHEGPPR